MEWIFLDSPEAVEKMYLVARDKVMTKSKDELLRGYYKFQGGNEKRPDTATYMYSFDNISGSLQWPDIRCWDGPYCNSILPNFDCLVYKEDKFEMLIGKCYFPHQRDYCRPCIDNRVHDSITFENPYEIIIDLRFINFESGNSYRVRLDNEQYLGYQAYISQFMKQMEEFKDEYYRKLEADKQNTIKKKAMNDFDI